MDIAFCINKLALIGFGVTISSLVKNCSDTRRLSIWILCSDLKEADKIEIKRLLVAEKFQGNLNILDVDFKSHFGQFRSLHGDWTAYGRLLLPSVLMNVSKVLYLDSDLVVEVDVLELEDINLGNYPLAAVVGAQIKHALEHDLFLSEFALTPEDKYFNSGVLFINLGFWRDNNIYQECRRIAFKYSNRLLAVDQTILNALFSSNFKILPEKFNCPWYADRERPTKAKDMILHYVGSPKPWDIGGKFLHIGFANWVYYLDVKWRKDYFKYDLGSWLRAWRIRRSLFKIINKKLKRFLLN